MCRCLSCAVVSSAVLCCRPCVWLQPSRLPGPNAHNLEEPSRPPLPLAPPLLFLGQQSVPPPVPARFQAVKEVRNKPFLRWPLAGPSLQFLIVRHGRAPARGLTEAPRRRSKSRAQLVGPRSPTPFSVLVFLWQSHGKMHRRRRDMSPQAEKWPVRWQVQAALPQRRQYWSTAMTIPREVQYRPPLPEKTPQPAGRPRRWSRALRPGLLPRQAATWMRAAFVSSRFALPCADLLARRRCPCVAATRCICNA